MMVPKISNLAASVHSRIKNYSRADRITFNAALQLFALERFLYRLSESEHQEKFVLKGALVFMGWRLANRRPTRDIDLRGYTENSIENMAKIIQAICTQQVVEDGLIFDPGTVTGEITQVTSKYEGIRVKFIGYLGKAIIPMQIDISFLDKINPNPIVISYPSMLDFPKASLKTYSHETVIAEKIEAIVSIGSANTRMKDYFDIWSIIGELEIEGTILKKSLETTFSTRGTVIPKETPPGLSEAFAEEKQGEWRAFLQKAEVSNKDIQIFSTVVQEIKDFIVEVLDPLAENKEFDKVWKFGKGWE